MMRSLQSAGYKGEEFNVGMILLASACGLRELRIAHETGLPSDFVRRVGVRLRRSGVWKNGRVCVNWLDPRSGGVEFALDVCVGMGWVKRRHAGIKI